MKTLAGKVFIITGGGGGIGGAAATRLAADGALIVLVDVNAESVRRVADSIGDNAYAVAADLSDIKAVDIYMGEALRRFGHIDGLFNNAAVLAPPTPFIDQTEQYCETQWLVNQRAVFSGTRQALRHFIEQRKPGSIVNTSSLAGVTGFRHLAAYTAAKHAVVGLSRVAAAEGAPYGVRVNVVCPGVILTSSAVEHFARLDPEVLRKTESAIPMGRGGRPDEVANLVAWLFSDEASYVSGAVIPIDGAMSAALQ